MGLDIKRIISTDFLLAGLDATDPSVQPLAEDRAARIAGTRDLVSTTRFPVSDLQAIVQCCTRTATRRTLLVGQARMPPGLPAYLFARPMPAKRSLPTLGAVRAPGGGQRRRAQALSAVSGRCSVSAPGQDRLLRMLSQADVTFARSSRVPRAPEPCSIRTDRLHRRRFDRATCGASG